MFVQSFLSLEVYRMKKFLLSLGALMLVASPALASPIKLYEAKGPLTEVDSQYIIVDNDGTKLQMTRDGTTQITSDLKKGDKVAIEYQIIAKVVKVTEAAKVTSPPVVVPPAAQIVPTAPAVKPTEVKPVENTESKPTEIKPAIAPIETKMDVKPADVKPVEVKAIEAKPAETKPADKKTETKPHDGKVVPAETAKPKTTEKEPVVKKLGE